MAEPRSTEPPNHRHRRSIPAALATLLCVLLTSCSSGTAAEQESDVFESGRTRPTDQSEHDHSGESSALAPETVLPSEIAELGEGVPAGSSGEFWIGVNICGRFVELPSSLSDGPLSMDGTGALAVSPAEGDPTGNDLTVELVADLLDVELATGSLAFGDAWAERSIGEADRAMPLGGASLDTGDDCTLGPEPEQGEVQLWYYTPLAVESGEQVRMVVTDPQDTPLVTDGSAITIAFAPVSSLPTLPPAALVG